ITVVILLTAAVSMILCNVNAANAQGNMSSASTNTIKSNMTGTALGAAKNMTSNMSTTCKASIMSNPMNNSR
ncbi:MAG: hypothetical protein WBF33_17460, partial [Candidatus Nitrosopolaris sp.]